MKKILSGIAFAVAAICVTSSVAMAASSCTSLVPPTTSGSTNVMTSPLNTSTGCTVGSLTFSNFNVLSSPAGMTVALSTVTTQSNGVALGFQVGGFSGTAPPDPDLVLEYEVSGGNITGINNTFGGTPGTSLLETVCDSAGITGNNCTDRPPLAFILVGSFGSMNTTFASQSSIWIIKDITVSSSFAGQFELSDFTNSTETTPTVPEPATLSMMGLGLLGLGLIGRRKTKV